MFVSLKRGIKRFNHIKKKNFNKFLFHTTNLKDGSNEVKVLNIKCVDDDCKDSVIVGGMDLY